MTVIRTVRDQIVDLIREDLLCGRHPVGKRLSEVELAARFGVSRGTIRQCLAPLVNEGLLLYKPNAGVTVAPEPHDAIRELVVPIRLTIETYALKSYFDQLTELDFRRWREILGRMQQACLDGDTEGIVLHDIAFHRSIIARARQADLTAIWQSLLIRVRGHFRRVVHQHGTDFIDIYNEHRQLVEQFRAGDLRLATDALAKHIW